MVAFLCAVSGGMAEKAIRFRLNCPHGLCRLISSRLFLAAACYCYCYTFYNMTKNQLWYVNNLNWMEKREACVRHKYLGFTQPPNTYAIVSSRFCSFKTKETKDTQPDGTLFFSHLLTWEVDLSEILEIMAQIWQYVIFLSLKPIKVTSDFILN